MVLAKVMHNYHTPPAVSLIYNVLSKHRPLEHPRYVLEKGGVNGNNTFSIGSGSTGHFQDSTPHTDTTNGGDKVCIGITPGCTALVITVIAATFSATR